MHDKGNGLEIHVTDLPSDGVDLVGSIRVDGMELDTEGRYEWDSPLEYRLHVSQLGEDLLVTGRLRLPLKALCDRCATMYSMTLETDDVCHRYEKVIGKVVDLTDDIREDILIVFPQSCLCSEDCRGLCPVCGANLNEGDCGCEHAETEEDELEDEESAAENPWGALDDLKLED